MAGDWIKMRIDLADDPAVISIAAMLGMDEDLVVGKLHRLWSWADQQTTDGTVTLPSRESNDDSVTVALLDRYARATGFAQAMVSVGWLHISARRVTFPNFERHNGKSGKQRALTAKRAVTLRSRKRNATSVTPSSLLSISIDSVPGELCTTEFLELWKLWKAHRKEIGHKLTPTSEAASLKKLAKLGIDRAKAMVQHTLEKGWRGLREPDDDERPLLNESRVPTDEDLKNWNPIDGGLGTR